MPSRPSTSGAAATGLACVVLMAGAFTALQPHAASAQTLARASLDSVTAVDVFRGRGATGNPAASVDISTVVRLGRGWSAHIRPWFFKSSADGSQWNKEIYQAAVRYERAGRTSLRMDAGYIASPVGLGMLDMRADVNPTIQPHLSYFMPLMRFDRGAPPVGAIAASYPLGVNVTVSGGRWDARAALINSAPTRRYALNAAGGNPAATPVAIGGGGVTVVPGFRLGGSFAAGRYASGREVTDATGASRNLRMWTAEAEYAFGYTKLAAEYTRERFARGTAVDTGFSWFVQGVQTLAPRWFAAARHEVIGAPPPATAGPGAPRPAFRTSEVSIGYRVSPEVTLRGSLAGQRGYTASSMDRRAGVQIVWSRRWW